MSRLITNILIPGRHHIVTNFQHDYLKEILDNLTAARDIAGQPIPFGDDIKLVWAITSANHANTRRNPLPAGRRESAIEHLGLPESYVFPIDNVAPTARFADHTIKDIEVASRGQFRLTPDNTVVAVSTPAVIAMYEALGYQILPIELADRARGVYSTPRAWDLVLKLVAAGSAWRQDGDYQKYVHPASRRILEKYLLGDLIVEVHNDPILGDEGDITETRDYATYRKAFEDGAERKYALIREAVRSGRIVDVGCATGAIIKLMGEDERLHEADLYGIEVARPLYEICQQRKAGGDFANENTFFYQRNIMTGKLFPDNSVDTTTTFSLTHEIESYIGRDGLLTFIGQVYEQTAPGGVFINSDVVGPEDGDRLIYMRLAADDGTSETDAERAAIQPASKDHLSSLSTTARFKRFAEDFRKSEGDGFTYETVEYGGATYYKLRLADACDFMSKKEYVDSWYSEMHERFCYWSFNDWKAALVKAGFTVNTDSYAYRNEWLVEHRYAGKVELFDELDGEAMDYPVTNMLLIAEKR